MANSEDPDQTAPSGAVWSGSAMFAYAILAADLVYEILGHLLYVSELLYIYFVCFVSYSVKINPFELIQKLIWNVIFAFVCKF